MIALPVASTAAAELTFPTPPAGGVTAGFAETTDPDAIVEAMPFEVHSISVFDLDEQRFHTFVPGAPDHVNAGSEAYFGDASIVWVRRADGAGGGSVSGAALSPSAGGSGGGVPASVRGVFSVPREGELTVGIAGTSDPAVLAATQSFEVESVIVRDIPTQQFLVYVPGAPDHFNTLTEENLQPDSVTWIRRAGIPPVRSAVPPPRDTESLLRTTSYESGEDRAESAHTKTSYGLGTTTEAARSGASAGYALLLPGDPKSNGGYRAEWHGVDSVGQGLERWQGISYYLPADWDQGDEPRTSDRRTIFQWHTTGSYSRSGQVSPIYGLQIIEKSSGPTYVFYRKDDYRKSDGSLGSTKVPLWQMRVQTGVWLDFAFNTIWSTGSDGKLVVYVNGREVYSHYGATLAGNTGVYSKWGIYGQPTRILFDEVRIAEGANQLATVSP